MKRDIRAFTLVELLVVIGIIAVLIGILVPTLAKARERGLAIVCASNMRQAGIALRMYQSEFKGYLPLPASDGLVWQHRLVKYITGIRPYEKIRCAAIDIEMNGKSTLSFGLNVVIVQFNFSMYKKTDRIRNPAKVILVADTIMRKPIDLANPYNSSFELMPLEGSPYTAYASSGIADYRHSKLANVLYLDLHVSADKLPPNDASSLGNQHAWKGAY
jgi:prepilin-type N-terminal cleavage/methylation domain-containing protein/prepilin-type processing-associated H-X9-DG protein